ncbi:PECTINESTERASE [Salix viminalis]|uniref:pectinesterase n=1 Tax=Salix viminalis TaxID=40686 RepID=A0A9Q0T7S0_SALVM|nr:PECTINESTERASE [Salix viminalis]
MVMESSNFFKGYGKVNPLPGDQSPYQQKSTASKTPNPHHQRFIHPLFFSDPRSSPCLCDVTQNPSSCFTSISSLNISTKPDPEVIFKLSLNVSITELKHLSSSFTSLHDVNSQAAMRDCVGLSDDSLGKLNDSLLAMEVGPGEKMLTLEKVKDIQTWISAAMTDQDTCIDGLEEMGSVLPDEMKAKMERSKDFLSISLAIISKMEALLEKFDLKMH